MTERELMAEKYANTAFSILFEYRAAPKPLTKDPVDLERKRAAVKANNDKQNALRKKNNVSADNKRKEY